MCSTFVYCERRYAAASDGQLLGLSLGKEGILHVTRNVPVRDTRSAGCAGHVSYSLRWMESPLPMASGYSIQSKSVRVANVRTASMRESEIEVSLCTSIHHSKRARVCASYVPDIELAFYRVSGEECEDLKTFDCVSSNASGWWGAGEWDGVRRSSRALYRGE